MRFACLIASAALLSGCAMRGPLSRVALEHNNMVARTTDEMMLTNILRARAREPMHFTSLSALHGNMSITAEADLTAALPTKVIERDHGPDGMLTLDKITKPSDTFTPVLKGTVATNPSFDLAVNDSQQFYQGFLAPIEPKTVAHFLDDGWPAHLLTYLLVGRFDFIAENTVFKNHQVASDLADKETDAAKLLLDAEAATNNGVLVHKGEVVRSLVNDADPDGADFTKFKNFVSCYNLHPKRVKKDDVSLLPIGIISTLDGIEKLDGKVFDVGVQNNVLTLIRKGGEADGLELVKTETADGASHFNAEVCSGKELVPNGRSTDELKVVDNSRFHFDLSPEIFSSSKTASQIGYARSYQGEGDYYFKAPDGDRVRIHVGIAATLRSTEALLYFLGEYARYKPEGRFQSMLGSQENDSKCQDGTPYDLLVLKDRRPDKSVLSATLHDKTWWVPDNFSECNGRTMEIIAFVEQLYNLQKSSTDKVGTQSVRLIQ